MTLRQYLTQCYRTDYYGTVAERLRLAGEFLNTVKDEYIDDCATRAQGEIVLLNADSVFVDEVPGDGEIRNYRVSFAEQTPSPDKIFMNYAYALPQVIADVDDLATLVPRTETEAVAYATPTAYDRDMYTRTVATLMFEIVFCVHPYKGRAYFRNADVSFAYEERFFLAEHRFVFDLDGNPNRFVNGYRDCARRLWQCLTHAQHEFWLWVTDPDFDGDFAAFAKGWHDAFDYVYNHLFAPCGQRFPALKFDEGMHALVVSSAGVSADTMPCRRDGVCLAGRSFCPADENNCVVRNVYAVATCFKVAIDGNSLRATFHKKVKLYPKRTLCAEDFGETGGEPLLRTVCSSKGVMGLRCIATTVKRLSDSHVYELGEVVPFEIGAKFMTSPTTFIVVNKVCVAQ